MSMERGHLLKNSWTGYLICMMNTKRSSKGIYFKTSIRIDTGIVEEHLLLAKCYDFAILKALIYFWSHIPQTESGTLIVSSEEAFQELTGRLVPADQSLLRLLKRVQNLLQNHPGIQFYFINRFDIWSHAKKIKKVFPSYPDDEDGNDDDYPDDE